jgi:hypothetical protein
MAASAALRTTAVFQVRAGCEPAAALLMVDVVEDGEDPAGGGGGTPPAAQQRLAVNAIFEERFVTMPELLETSLRRKICPLLLLAA